MSLILIERIANLNGPIIPDTLNGVLNGSEIDAHKFIVTATRDGATVALTGTVTASFLRADGAEVVLTGEIEDGAATVTLAQSCYAVPGRFDLTIFVTADGVKTGVYACTGGVRNTTSGTILDPGQIVPSVDDIIAKQAELAQDVADASSAIASAQNAVSYLAPVFSTSRTYAVGEYVTKDGALYVCTTAVETAGAWDAAKWQTVTFGGEVSDLKNALDYNLPLLNLMPIKASSATVLGVNVSYRAGVLTSNGTATGSGGRLTHIVDFSLEAGTYNISVYGDATLLVLHKSSDNTIIAQINASTATSATFTLYEKTALFIGVNLVSGRTYAQQVNISLVSGTTAGVFYPPEKRDIIDSIGRETAAQYYGNSVHIMPTNGGITDFNDAELNRIYLVISTDNVDNMPVSASGTLLTYGRVDTSIVQLYMTANLSYWFRRKWANSWSGWKQFADVSSIPSVDDILAKQLDVLPMFDNITCCGDSLTYSQVYTGATTSRKAKNSYPQVLAKITGTNVTEIASPGYSASNWWRAYQNQIVAKDNQCAIVYLGANDGFTDTLDVDAPTDATYADWADTNTGNLAKIVAKWQEVGAKVILVKCYATSGTGTSDLATTNSVITKIAERFKCGLAENSKLTDSALHLYPDRSGENTVHYNDIGYAKFARHLANNIASMDSAYLQFIIPG